MAALRRGAGAAVVTSALSYLGVIQVESDPVVANVNPNDELLEAWDLDVNADAEPECRWLDGNTVYESALCSHFVISRAASSPPRAFDRALACAAKHHTTCVLSPEIGLSVPAAFLVHPSSTTMVLAPRIGAPPTNETVNVRIHEPGRPLATRSMRFNRSVSVSFLDGRTRREETRVFTGDDAHCVSLLRVSFSPGCWEKLD